MIKSLKDARIVDGLPRILAKQPWVQALSEAMGIVNEMTLLYADASQIYTDIDHASENILDALAVNWKVDWYDTGYSVEIKRRIIKSALTVRRTMGTAGAVKLQVNAIYPDAIVEEWFQYGGDPGCFRVLLELPENGISAEEYQRFKKGILVTKNERSHMDAIDIRYERETKLTTGGCSAVSQIIEVWPELVALLEITATQYHGGAVRAGQTMEVWPEVAEQVELTVELAGSGVVAASQTVEIYPEGGECT